MDDIDVAKLPIRVQRAIEQYSIGSKVGFLGANKMQRPSYFLFPGLQAKPFWYEENDRPAWIVDLEAAADAIKAELLPLLQNLTPEQYEMQAGTISHSYGRWKVYYLLKESEVIQQAAAQCPNTTAAILRIPTRLKNSSLGYGMFSVLDGHGVIQPHFGPVNIRLRCMLPIVVPRGGSCTLTVGGETRTLQEGKAVVFDDSFQHEALNGCEGIRVGLILDIWHPELTDDEILHITHLLARFEQETGIQAKPPPRERQATDRYFF